jgi:Fe-S-cluster containining protein
MNPYGISTLDANIRAPIVSLNVLYDQMPETYGCEKCHEVNGADAIWCCRELHPSMYYVEFLNIWQEVQKWNKDKRADVIVRSIRNHLIGEVEKGCIFWSGECLVYERRPLSCRIYGVIPEQSWNARIDTLKKRYGEDYNPRPQCNLVSVKGDVITKDQEDKWFKHTRNCELRIGMSPESVNAHDDPQGSYRTFHDHILLELFDEEFLTKLSMIRLSKPSITEIDEFVEVLETELRKNGII